jgi:hypothetical protein
MNQKPGFLNMYEFNFVRASGPSSLDAGVTILVYAPDMVTARDKAMYLRRKNRWMDTTPQLHNVKLNKTAYGHVRGHVAQENEPVTAWYRNMKSMIGDAALRIG